MFKRQQAFRPRPWRDQRPPQEVRPICTSGVRVPKAVTLGLTGRHDCRAIYVCQQLSAATAGLGSISSEHGAGSLCSKSHTATGATKTLACSCVSGMNE